MEVNKPKSEPKKKIHYADMDAPKTAPVVAIYDEEVVNSVPRKQKKGKGKLAS